jgi:two-component system response regulator
MLQPFEILVVEDYEPDAHLLQLLLKRHHILNKAHAVTDGSSALDFLFARGTYSDRASEPLPGVVIMDIRLPKLDGWEVLRQIRQNPLTNDLPVIIMTGSLFEKEQQAAHLLGANACISKPIRIEALRSALNQCGFSWAIAEPETV